jgi:hypothetical protein
VGGGAGHFRRLTVPDLSTEINRDARPPVTVVLGAW